MAKKCCVSHAAIKKAAWELLVCLDEINADPSHAQVFTSALLHGVPYTGPDWVEEHTALKKALEDSKSDS